MFIRSSFLRFLSLCLFIFIARFFTVEDCHTAELLLSSGCDGANPVPAAGVLDITSRTRSSGVRLVPVGSPYQLGNTTDAPTERHEKAGAAGHSAGMAICRACTNDVPRRQNVITDGRKASIALKAVGKG